MPFYSPIDFAALRATLSALVQTATGLPSNQVVLAEPESVHAPLPDYPFVTFELTTVTDTTADYEYRQGDDGTFRLEGDHLARVGFEAFGRSHDEAHGLGLALFMGLCTDDCSALMRAANVALRDLTSIVDLSTLLETGFEGRARFELVLGMTASLPLLLPSIGGVGIGGVVNQTPDVTLTIVVPE